jgi:hypothetical protein
VRKWSLRPVFECVAVSLEVFHHALLQYVLAQRRCKRREVLAFHTERARVRAGRRRARGARRTRDAMVLGAEWRVRKRVGLRIAHVRRRRGGRAGRRTPMPTGTPQARSSNCSSIVVTKYYAVINTQCRRGDQTGHRVQGQGAALLSPTGRHARHRPSHCSLVAALNAADVIESFSKAERRGRARAPRRRALALPQRARRLRARRALRSRTACPTSSSSFGGDALPVLHHLSRRRSQRHRSAPRRSAACASTSTARSSGSRSKEASSCLACKAAWNRASCRRTAAARSPTSRLPAPISAAATSTVLVLDLKHTRRAISPTC